MKQQQVIEAATKRFANDERLKALFLSGSYGNETADDFSDVDFLVVVGDEDRKDVIADFLKAIESVGPLISSNTMELGVSLVNNVLADWTRFDLVVGDERVLGGKTQDGLKVLTDPTDLWSGLPETAEWTGPNPHQVEAVVKEYTRILGLTSVGKGRNEITTVMLGTGLLRTNLVALMTAAVPMVDTGGALHHKKIFPEQHLQALIDLPVVEPNWPSVLGFSKACSTVFYSLARRLMKDAGGTWPDRFVEATRAHLIEAIGSDLVGD